VKEFNGSKFEVRFGEFAAYLRPVVDNLRRAIPYAANQHQVQMLEHYIQFFESGKIQSHKES
jgi:dipeptidyl-peptidase III